MKAILKKLLLGNVSRIAIPDCNPVKKCINNIKAIWNNEHQDDNGIEKIVRLFLSSSQLLFPGVYIKYLASIKGYEYRDLASDLYVLLETVLYIPTLIFASDLFSKPRSYKRSMLLLFLNYTEIIFAFGVLYSCGDYFNKPFENWFDSVYFSIITSSSIGYGDYYPVKTIGKILVSAQAMLFLFFVVLFLNFFSTKIKSKGYFDIENNS